MSGAHLFDGHALAEGRYGYPGGYVAVCGTMVQPCIASGEGGDRAYCPACMRAAASWNAQAGRAPGAVAHSGDSWSVHVR